MRIFIPFVLLITLFVACNNSTEPQVDETKDPREYTWTIDTLEYPGEFQTGLRSIWGSSPSDVYAVGHCSDIQGQMWHFDGKQWKSFYVPFGVAYIPGKVYGFGKNDIWIGGDFSNNSGIPAFLIHYNGSTWNRVNLPDSALSIESIGGFGPNDVWFGGINGTLLHWDGTSISKEPLPIKIPYNVEPLSNFLSIAGNNSTGNYFFVRSPEYRSYLLRYSQNNYTIIDSNSWYREKLWVSEKGNLYQTGEVGFYRWNGNGWDNLLPNQIITTAGIAATSENNIFISGIKSNSGFVYHYNGNDFYLYENLQLQNVSLYDAWTDGKEVFILGANYFDLNSTLKTIILHGK